MAAFGAPAKTWSIIVALASGSGAEHEPKKMAARVALPCAGAPVAAFQA